jgi:hypothetical protein
LVSKAIVGRVVLSESEECIETNWAEVILCLVVSIHRFTVLDHQRMSQFHRYDMAAEIIEAVKG